MNYISLFTFPSQTLFTMFAFISMIGLNLLNQYSSGPQLLKKNSAFPVRYQVGPEINYLL